MKQKQTEQIETNKQQQQKKRSVTKSWSFEMIKKIDKSLARLLMKKHKGSNQ